jgi:hypothetical protein
LYIDGMIATPQRSVNFFLLPRIQRAMAAKIGSVSKNLLTVLLLLADITVAITAVYCGQLWYYNQHRPPLPASGTGLQKITGFTRDNVFDLSGAEASGYSDPLKLFDENADPANGQLTHPNTNPLPVAKLPSFFPPGKGMRIVADLQDQYAVTDFYVYDKSLETDSVWLYTGDMQHWTAVAAFASTGNAAGWGWRHFHLQQSSRYVMIRFNSAKPIVSEWVIYGKLEKKLPPDNQPRLAPLPAPTLRQFAGTNVYDYVQPALLQPFSQVRFYQMMDYYDVDTVNAYPQNQLTLNVFNLPPAQTPAGLADSLQRYGNHVWMSIRGMPKYLQLKGRHEKDKPVTLPGMDTENPFSYGRHAKTFWTLAAVLGNTRQDTNLLDITDRPKPTGLKLMERYENGNEEDGFWTAYYWTPVDYFALSSADYDGHEGRMGPRHGLRQADSSAKLMTSGMIQLDTNRVRTLNFLCRTLRRDKKFIWEGGVQYHYYSNAATSNLQSPVRGLSPEEDHMRQKLAKVRAFHDRLLPGIPLILGENGYDRNQHSWQRTPLIPGRTEAQSQAIMCTRALLAAFMAGFDGYNQYMMRSATNDENAQGPYATSGMIGGPANNVIYPVWYYWSAMVQNLGDYQPDAVESETGPVWIYRFKHRENPAKKAWVVFSPTAGSNILLNYSLKLKYSENQYFTKIGLTDNSSTGVAKTGQFSSGTLRLDIGESPVILRMN